MSRNTIFFTLSFLFLAHNGCFMATYELNIWGEARYGYYVTMHVGVPPQAINLLIDTGSSNLAIASVPLYKGNKKGYEYNKSRTFKNLGTNVNVHYVQGQWYGFFATDLVSLDHKNKVFINCTIACITETDGMFDENTKFEGLLGLAYPSISKPNSSIVPFFDTVLQSQNISDIFAMSLCGPIFSNPDRETSCGKLHLGFISPKYFTGSISYTPIIKERFYEVILTNLSVDAKQITTNCRELNEPRAIIDSGTTCLHLPKQIYTATIREIKESVKKKIVTKFWFNDTVACTPKKSFDVSNFPIITLSFYHTDNGSFNLQVSPELYLVTLTENSARTTCFQLGIRESDYGTIIGSTILKGYYVIFDRFNKRIGFGNSTFGQSATQNTVTTPIYSSNANCGYEYEIPNSHISVATIIFLIVALVMAFLLLYMMIVWFRSCTAEHSDNHSDTSSLVDDDHN